MRTSNYDIDKKMINNIRSLILKENENKGTGKETTKAIAITNEPKFGQNALQGQIDAFRQSVNGGAKFAKPDASNPENSPLVYFPSSGNLVFSGSIPSLSDLRFQFSLNDVTGAPYIFVDGLSLTQETITTLNKIYGFYQNWRDEWFAAGDLLEKLKKENQ